MPSGSMFSHGVWRSPAKHWDWLCYVQKLTWLYGEDRTIRILRGRDAETQADLAKWRRLGR